MKKNNDIFAEEQKIKLWLKIAIAVFSTIIFMTILLAATLWTGVNTRRKELLGYENIYPGVLINGIDLSDKSIEKAYELLNKENQPLIDDISVTVLFEENKWTFDNNDLKVRIDTDDRIVDAYNIGRQGDDNTRIKDIYMLLESPINFKTKIVWDTAEVFDEIDRIAKSLYIAPIDATIEFYEKENEKFKFTEDTKGRSVKADSIKITIDQQLLKSDYSPVKMKADILYPDIKLDEVNTWTSLLTRYYTKYTSSSSNRIHNIKLSSAAIDGLMLMPGQQFSLNDTTGARDRAAGYKDAGVIINGKLTEAPGGGNCQSSTTLYGASVRADLIIVQRYPHSWPSSYVNIGQDAAVDYPSKDIVIKNPYDTPLFFNIYHKNKRIYIEIYGKKQEEWDNIKLVSKVVSKSSKPTPKRKINYDLKPGEEKEKSPSRAKIITESYRVYYLDGKEVKREFETKSTYPKMTGLVEYNPQEPTPQPVTVP